MMMMMTQRHRRHAFSLIGEWTTTRPSCELILSSDLFEKEGVFQYSLPRLIWLTSLDEIILTWLFLSGLLCGKWVEMFPLSMNSCWSNISRSFRRNVWLKRQLVASWKQFVIQIAFEATVTLFKKFSIVLLSVEEWLTMHVRCQSFTTDLQSISATLVFQVTLLLLT